MSVKLHPHAVLFINLINTTNPCDIFLVLPRTSLKAAVLKAALLTVAGKCRFKVRGSLMRLHSH